MQKGKFLAGLMAASVALSVIHTPGVAFAEETTELKAGSEVSEEETEAEEEIEAEEETEVEEETEAVEEETEAVEEETSEIKQVQLSVREDIAGGTVEITSDITSIEVGDTVTFTATAEEGYMLTSVGYWTVKENGTKGSLKKVTADENGYYSFVVPEGNVMVGAAFQNKNDLVMYDNRIGGTKETDWTLYLSLGDAFLYESSETVDALLRVDKRFLEQENLTFNLELRQYNNAYTVVGKKTITVEELNHMIENPDKGMKVTEDDTTVTIEGLQFDIANDKDLTEGYFVYSVVQFAKDTWVDAKGDAEYRWTYTGDATVLKDGANMPDPIVWLYNLDEDTSRGALIRSILNELEIPVGTVTNENLNQNIGYLVDWDGYDPVEDPYSTESYNVEYILMGNLAETKLDQFLDGMIENNIRVNLKSVPTAWTASKTFAELFDIMAEEDEVFQAIFALDDLIYDAELLTEEKYGNSDHWRNFKIALDAANAAMGLEEDELEEKGGADFLWDAYDALQDQYLLVTGTELLDGELELILEENEDGTFNLSAQVHGEENPAFDYKWMYTSTTTDAVLENVPAADLYKVKLEVSGTDGFYGKLTASLKVPSDPAFTLSAGKTSISVQLQKMEAVMNMPAVDKYVVQLYKDGLEIAEKEVVSGNVTFDGLTKSTEYTVKVCAYNEVGRSDIIEGKVKTSAGSSGGGSSSSSGKEKTKKEDVTEEDTSEEIADMEKPAEDTATESSVDAIEKFKDVKAKDWFAPAVSYVYEKGLMSGVEVDEFGAYMTTTRAMIWTVLARMDGVTTSSKGVWYEAGREWAMKNGISDGTDPMGNITREQLASMLYRYAKHAGEVVTTKEERLEQFKDNAAISDYAVQAMSWAVGEGIINGNDDGTLNPDGNAQRVHAAQMLMNFDKIMK